MIIIRDLIIIKDLYDYETVFQKLKIDTCEDLEKRNFVIIWLKR